MQQDGSKYFANRPPLTLGMGLVGQIVGQNSTFLEHSHVAYQIKENNECSNMVGRRSPTDSGDGVSRSSSIFPEHGHVAYQFKGNHEMQQHGSKYFACRPSPDYGMGSIG